RERRRFGHQLDGLRPPERARQPLGAAGAWQDSERDLRQADLSRVHARDAQIAGEGDLQSAAHAVSVDRRDHELRRLLQPAERLVRVQAEVVLEVGSTLLKHLDIRPRAEELVARACQHQDVDGFIHSRIEDVHIELAHHLELYVFAGGFFNSRTITPSSFEVFTRAAVMRALYHPALSDDLDVRPAQKNSTAPRWVSPYVSDTCSQHRTSSVRQHRA